MCHVCLGLPCCNKRCAFTCAGGAGSEDGSGRRGTGGSTLQGAGAGASELVDRQASIFDQLERRDRRQARWQVAIAGLLDGVPYTLLSVVITLMVSQHCAWDESGRCAW